MKTAEPKSPISTTLQRSSTAPFFQPKESKSGFGGEYTGQAPFFHPTPKQIQKKPSECVVPKVESKEFARIIQGWVQNNRLTEAEASDLLTKYGDSHVVSRCKRGQIIHELKTKANTSKRLSPVLTSQTPPPPVVPAPTPSSQAAARPSATAGVAVALPGNNAIYQTVQNSLETFLDRYSNIAVTVSWVDTTDPVGHIKRSETISVHPPYFIYREGTDTRIKADKNRDDASKKMKALLKEIRESSSKGGMGLRRALGAKASPEDIRAILQKALDQNLIPAGKGRNRPNSQDMQDWLKRYGIGVDCSGFVSHALNQMMRDVIRGPLTQEQELDVVDIYSGNLKGGTRRKDKFEPVKTPRELRPGDTMHVDRPKGKIDHIRIITSVQTTPEGFIEFKTAESTAGGPGKATWRYEKADKFNKHNPLKKLTSGQTWGAGNKGNEKITYGRYKQLKTQ